MNRSTDLARAVAETSAAKVAGLESAQSPAAFIAAVVELAGQAAARAVAEQAKAHPGIDVTIPTPAAVPLAAPTQRSRRLFTRAELFGYCGIWSGATAAGCGLASLFTSSPAVWGIGAVGGLLVSFGAAVVSHGEDNERQAQGWAERNGGAR